MHALNSEDYELYRIPLPLFQRRASRNAFISNELEKMHPCFSDRCSCDTKLRLEKGKLVASVTVIDKLRLAQYKLKFPGLLFIIEEKRKEYVFLSTKNKILWCTSIVILLIAISGAFFACRSNMMLHRQSALAKECSSGEQLSPVQQKTVSLQEVCSALFAVVRLQGGSVMQCSLSTSQSQEKQLYEMNATLSGCYPESIVTRMNELGVSSSAMTISPVSYSNKIPTFAFACSLAETYTPAAGEVMIDLQNIRAPLVYGLRNQLLSEDAEIISEDSANGILSFQIAKNHFASAAEKGESFLQKAGGHLSSIELEQNEKNISCSVTIAAVSRTSFEKTLSLFALCLEDKKMSCTVEQNETHVMKKSDGNQTQRFVEVSGTTTRVKVGQITTADGTCLVYYKNTQGLIMEEKE